METLPKDIILEILKGLDHKDLSHFGLTSKKCNSYAQLVWKHKQERMVGYILDDKGDLSWCSQYPKSVSIRLEQMFAGQNRNWEQIFDFVLEQKHLIIEQSDVYKEFNYYIYLCEKKLNDLIYSHKIENQEFANRYYPQLFPVRYKEVVNEMYQDRYIFF
jgi:hypothetical protein